MKRVKNLAHVASADVFPFFIVCAPSLQLMQLGAVMDSDRKWVVLLDEADQTRSMFASDFLQPVAHKVTRAMEVCIQQAPHVVLMQYRMSKQGTDFFMDMDGTSYEAAAADGSMQAYRLSEEGMWAGKTVGTFTLMAELQGGVAVSKI